MFYTRCYTQCELLTNKLNKMEKVETLILGREDMIENRNGKDIRVIDFTDFKLSIKPFQENAIILFIDDNGNTKILKNRFGDKGNSMFIMTMEQMKIDNDVCIGLNTNFGDEYFDNIISTYSN